MGWMARRASGLSPRTRVFAILLSAVAVAGGLGAAALVPANAGAAARPAATPTPSQSTSSAARAFGGVSFVGVLFATPGGIDSHSCTASVVQSAHGDLAVTAAHCLDGVQGGVSFAPGYANGKEPYGVWQVTAIYTDQAWQSDQNPDDDVAFVRLADLDGKPIQSVTGADRLGTASSKSSLVRVIGYPDGTDQPVSCVNWASHYSATQLQFDCDNFTDGTSGGPFIVGASGAKGTGTVVGVIGGYEQGGDTPEVSYASAFGATVTALYRQAEAAG
jgi:hypothetical protein